VHHRSERVDQRAMDLDPSRRCRALQHEKRARALTFNFRKFRI
jgi:hypothetical protein